MPRAVRFTREQLAAAVAASTSWSETLRLLGYRPAGGNTKTVQKYARLWAIQAAHFDPYASQRGPDKARRIPLEEILVERSRYSRGHLKERLYEAELKSPVCELCGQDEIWRGRVMALILDHINGIWDDNRLQNLRIVCPNCAATLHTHCGRKNLRPAGPRSCRRCGKAFIPRRLKQRYCSRDCGTRRNRRALQSSRPRRVRERPPREQLVGEVEDLGYSAVGRKYGVSDNAIRKWLKAYERKRAIAEGRDPGVIRIPTRTWPNARARRAA